MGEGGVLITREITDYFIFLGVIGYISVFLRLKAMNFSPLKIHLTSM